MFLTLNDTELAPIPVYDGGMKTIVNDSNIKTLEQVRQFLAGTAAVELCIDA